MMDECRFCKEGPEAGTLISPCACKGSIALVHAHCLQAWFNHKRASPDAPLSCEVCGQQFALKLERTFVCWPKLFCSCSSFSLYFECAMFGSVFVLSIVAHAMFWAEQRHKASKSQLSAAERAVLTTMSGILLLFLCMMGALVARQWRRQNSVPVISGSTAAGPAAATTALTVERPAACPCPTAPAPPRCERCCRCGVRVSRRRMAALLVVLALASVGLCALILQQPHAGGRRAIFARRPTIARDVVRDLARLAESLGRPTTLRHVLLLVDVPLLLILLFAFHRLLAHFSPASRAERERLRSARARDEAAVVVEGVAVIV